MEHIFIINPVAGTGKAREYFMPRIVEELKKLSVSHRIHMTAKIGDAEEYVQKVCRQRKDKDQVLRFYACGGDGTLNEVINGGLPYANVEFASIPAGTGNDFIRNFDEKRWFKKISQQIQGKAQMVDGIQYAVDEGKPRIGVNIINMGLDCEAVLYMNQARSTKLLKGTSAYVYGVARAFAELKPLDLSIIIDNNEPQRQQVTLLAVGNGTAYGGGFRALPRAKVDDGIMDVSIVKAIGRRRILNLIGAYKQGKHLELKRASDVVDYHQCRKISIQSQKEMDFCVDGELYKGTKLDVRILHQVIPFVIPEDDK